MAGIKDIHIGKTFESLENIEQALKEQNLTFVVSCDTSEFVTDDADFETREKTCFLSEEEIQEENTLIIMDVYKGKTYEKTIVLQKKRDGYEVVAFCDVALCGQE